MSDDIDIEEHDVLDNPRIRNIFPDISCIKTEVIDYEETYDEIESSQYSADEVPCQIKEEPHNYDGYNYVTNESKEVLNSSQNYRLIESDLDSSRYGIENSNFHDQTPSFSQNYNNPSTSQIETLFHQDKLNYLQESPMEQDISEVESPYQNMIILGTKPCTDTFETSNMSNSDSESDTEILPCYVDLLDLGVMLTRNSCYCAECNILFPTQNAIDAHKMMAHSFLVAVRKNTAMKSTAKPSFLPNSNLLCTHCNKYFPNEDILLKHTYELIPDNFSPEIPKKCAPGLYYICPICTILFKTLLRLKSHAIPCHNLLDVSPKMAAFNPQCAYCTLKTPNRRSHAKHIARNHKNIYLKRVSNDKFECNKCNLTFPSAYSEKIHRAAKHLPLEEYSPSKSLFQAVPKSTLFKCNKCQIHFIYCATASEHTKNCKLTKGDWKCPKCRRSFKLNDRTIHTEQHNVTDRFKVYVVGTDIVQRVICRCLNCNVSFDERSFLKEHEFGCVKTNSYECKICHLHINEKSVGNHKSLHDFVDSNEFIIRDFLCSKPNINLIEPACNTKTLKSTNGVPKKSCRREFVYCSSCKCCMRTNSHKFEYHISGQCKNLRGAICKYCGLTFTPKSIYSHRIDHKQNNLKLRDMKFFDMQKNEMLSPPNPDFKLCVRCKVYFFSRNALRHHTCNSEDSKTCRVCKKQFSDLAYKLHLPFHEFTNFSNIPKSKTKTKFPKISSADGPKTINQQTLPELLKKYESLQTIWNILYLCINCDIAYDSYDAVVEHCQDHFNNLQNYDQTIAFCDVCDLKMISSCFHKHNKLHANNVTKSAFKILKFEYKKLLGDDWFNIFKTLADDQVKQVLTKSIYNLTRRIRMELSTDGPADLTLYLCKVCNTIVESADVVDHANRLECPKKNVKFICSVCRVDFSTEQSLAEHKKLHNNKRAAKEFFRIISFGNRNDSFNNTLLEMKCNDLKFIRCQHCGKLINKSKYKGHIANHLSLKNLKFTKHKPPNASKHKPKFSVKSKQNVWELFKCRYCKVCVKRWAIQTHKTCVDSTLKSRCDQCKLWFQNSTMKHHLNDHQQNKNVKINVYYMKDGNIERNELGQRFKVGSVLKPPKGMAKTPKFIENEIGKIIFYQCAKCRGIIRHKSNIQKHNCATKFHKCTLCGFHLYTRGTEDHYKLHSIRPFSRKDVKIIKFGGDVYSSSTSKESKNKLKPKVKTPKINKQSTVCDTKLKFKQISENSRYVKHIKFYKCSKCSVFITKRKWFLSHILKCDGKTKTEECHVCKIKVKAGCLQNHLKLVECETRKIGHIYASLEIRNKDVHTDDKWLYCCHKCQAYFLTYKRYLYHVNTGHNSQKFMPCNLCGIQFAAGLKNHLETHHDVANPLMHLNIETLHEKMPIKSVSGSAQVLNKPKKSIESLKYGKQCKENSENEITKRSYWYRVGTKLDQKQIEIIKKLQLLDPVRTYKLHKSIKVPTSENSLYRCHICELHFINYRTLEWHVIENDHYIRRTSCSECKLSFTPATMKKHMPAHEKYSKFLIYTLDDLINLLETRVVDFINPDRDAHKTNTIDNAKASPEISYNEGEMSTYDSNTGATETIDHITEISLNKNDTAIKKDLVHKENEISKPSDRKFAIKTKLTQQHIEKIKNQLLLEPNRTYQLHKGSEIASKNVLYRCHICNLHFTNHRTLESHVIRKTHYSRRTVCPECNLPFTPLILKRHLPAHKIYNEFVIRTLDELITAQNIQAHSKVTTDDIQDKIDNIIENEIATSNKSNIEVSLAEVSTYNNGDVSASIDNITNMTSNEDDAKHDLLQISTYSNADTSSNTSNIIQTYNDKDDSLKSEGTGNSIEQNTRIDNKLHKCGECDVFFSTAKECNDHCQNHEMLDPTEYIACKVCDLQFLCEYLGKHMKKHKEKTFNIEDIIVAEYHPSESDVKIVTYLAVDALKLKQVTTTTHSDIE